jgi:DNA sulfur modification protein DndB
MNKLILPCLRGVIGEWVYYSTLMNASQINNWIQTAKDIREAKSLDEELQRDLQDRKKNIAKYLLKDNSRFFNSIIVGIFDGVPDWREFDLKTVRDEYSEYIDIKSLKESIGLMIFNGTEKMFAIDGQHRVAGIQLAYQEDVLGENKLEDDQFSVIFVAHIDDKSGMRRTRKLFSDINKNAKPVAKRDKIIIDEQDICSIVTRRILSESPYFNEGKLISLSESNNLDSDDVLHFTNITNLYDVIKIIKPLYKLPKGANEWDEDSVLGLNKIVQVFLDTVFTCKDEYRKFFITNELTLPHLRFNNSYLLFRPIGFKLIARLYVDFYKNSNVDFFISNIDKISYVFPDSPFNKISWNNGKMDTKGKTQNLMFDLSLYLLGQYKKDIKVLHNSLIDVTKNDYIQLPKPVIINE